MGCAMNPYHGQVIAAAEPLPLAPAHRMFFVRHGSMHVNEVALEAGDTLFAPDALTVTSTVEWFQVWRWEIALVNAAPSPARHGDRIRWAARSPEA